MTNEMNTAPSAFPIDMTYLYAGAEYPIKFKSSIGLVGIGALVEQIVDTLVDEDGYYPYYYESALYGNILNAYSDFSCDSVVKLDDIMTNSNMIEVIQQAVHSKEWKLIIDSIDQLLEYRKQKLAAKSEFDALIGDIRNIIADVNERFIKPLDEKALQKMIKNFGNIKITEKGLVDALVKAKVIDKEFSKKDSKGTGKVINLSEQQKTDGVEIKTDEVE